MYFAIFVLTGFFSSISLFFSLPVHALEMDNPYVKPAPSAPSQPVPAPTYRQAPIPHRYKPQKITPARPPQVNTGPNANHIQWCQTRYRSYRLSDNSYRPLSGGGRINCNSPFGP